MEKRIEFSEGTNYISFKKYEDNTIGIEVGEFFDEEHSREIILTFDNASTIIHEINLMLKRIK